jgi:hypothetical protein
MSDELGWAGVVIGAFVWLGTHNVWLALAAWSFCHWVGWLIHEKAKQNG